MISAIMPTFNRAHLLTKRYEELLAQTVGVTQWELIIVDDCSTDNTKEVIWSWNPGHQVKYIRLDRNSGCVTIPRNIGIGNALGDFICHIDDDVENSPDKFEALQEPLLKYPKAILAYGDQLRIQPGVSKTLSVIDNWNPLTSTGVDNGQIMYRNIYDKIPLVYCTRACDWELAKILICRGRFIHVPKTISIYTWHGTNRSLDPSTKFRPMDIPYYNKYLPLNKFRQVEIAADSSTYTRRYDA